MKRTYRPRIRLMVGPRYTSLMGVYDWSAVMKANGITWQWWECVGYGKEGNGATPKDAYDSWYKNFIFAYSAPSSVYRSWVDSQVPKITCAEKDRAAFEDLYRRTKQESE